MFIWNTLFFFKNDFHNLGLLVIPIIEREKKHFIQTYKRIPLDIAYGEGVHLVTRNGTRYLDFFCGIGVNSLGHVNEKIITAIQNQVEKFSHLSNYFVTDIQVEFAEKLLKYSKMSRLFLTNSGAETVEAALKAVRKKKGSDGIIFSMSNSFHGRTYGALSLTDQNKYKKDFGPLLPNLQSIKFNDIHDLQAKINEHTSGVFLEFIQGEGGINVVSAEFVSALIELQNKYKFVLVADCIQAGLGRTGKSFAFNHYNVEPDIVLVAKSIGGGLPLGAMLVNDEFTDIFTYGEHGTTFGGNPISCAAGKVVLEEVFENGLLESVEKLGDYFLSELNNLASLFPSLINEVRGKGFMIGVEMFSECNKVVESLMERKVLANCTNKNVLRILPPLVSTKTDIDFFLYNFHEILKKQ